VGRDFFDLPLTPERVVKVASSERVFLRAWKG
jgi:hypothetical protein